MREDAIINEFRLRRYARMSSPAHAPLLLARYYVVAVDSASMPSVIQRFSLLVTLLLRHKKDGAGARCYSHARYDALRCLRYALLLPPCRQRHTLIAAAILCARYAIWLIRGSYAARLMPDISQHAAMPPCRHTH